MPHVDSIMHPSMVCSPRARAARSTRLAPTGPRDLINLTFTPWKP